MLKTFIFIFSFFTCFISQAMEKEVPSLGKLALIATARTVDSKNFPSSYYQIVDNIIKNNKFSEEEKSEIAYSMLRRASCGDFSPNLEDNVSNAIRRRQELALITSYLTIVSQDFLASLDAFKNRIHSKKLSSN